MGYTHYWQGTAPVLTGELKDQIRAVFAYCKNTNIFLADGFGVGEPELSGFRLWMNGDELRGEDYETFGITFGADVGFDFCKTAHQPYDVAVVAILEILAVASHGKFSWTSDGDRADGLRGPDHTDGLAIAASILAGEDILGSHGRCDTCGATMNAPECPADLTHAVAVE